MKTALQELIDKLSDFRNELSDKYDSDPYVIRGISIAMGEANKLLEKEKQQIAQAYLNGGYDGIYFAKGVDQTYSSGEDYYNQTYNNEP